jgi:putative phage-type endonuclease
MLTCNYNKQKLEINNSNSELDEIFNNVCSQFLINSNLALSLETYKEFKNMFIDTVNTFYPHLSYINDQLDNVLNIKYSIVGFCHDKINKNINTINFNKLFTTCEERDNFYDINYNNQLIINRSSLSELQVKLYNQYEHLMNLPQPAQKSKEWFDKRNNMLTASNGGAAIGESHYNTIKEVILDKLGLGPKFKENKFVYHGKKYEKIAIMIYEIIYNTKVGEFGLIQHPKISYLGASPDGISMSLTLDGKLNKLLGRMLEIKCPPSRKINNLGKIKGDICPDYYWIQVQLQLECCDLPECDFWQCHLIEPYMNETEFLDDEVDKPVHTENQYIIQNKNTEIKEEPLKIQIDNRIKKGAIIELLPINKSHIPPKESWEWYGVYIYPPTILMTGHEYKLWTTNTIKNLKTLYPELVSKYKFSKVVYWKLAKSHNELITRQIEWFENNKSKYEKFWSRVLYYREHLEEAKEDIQGQRLSNDVFLYTDSMRIPKIKSLVQFKKSLNLNTNTNDHESNLDNHNSENIFLTNSTISNSDPNKKKKYITSIKTSKDSDIFLTSTESPKNVKIIQKKMSIVNIIIPINDNVSNDDETLDLVIITENRKKKNIQKKNKS